MEYNKKKVYINTEKLKTDKNAVFCYISSDRSDGKSTDIIRSVFDEYKKSGKIGVIARRYAGEVTEQVVETFFTNLKKVRETGELTHKGSVKKSGVALLENGKQFGIFVCLSRSTALKSSLDSATHKDLYIDEYIPLNGRYLQNEVETILELWRTIDRDTFLNKIYVYSNHVTESCPIFSYFEIVPKNGLTKYKNGRFVLLQVANEGNRDIVKKSPIGELVSGTSYYNYISGGVLDDKNIKTKKHSKNRLQFIVAIDKKDYAFFLGDDGILSLDRAERHQKDTIYCTTPNGAKNDGIYLPFANDLYKYLKKMLNLGKIFVASSEVYDDAQPLLLLLGDKKK